MNRWLITATTIIFLITTPLAMADRDHHERGRDWHKEHGRSDGRIKMRVRDPHEYHYRHHQRDNGWHRGHDRKHRWDRDDYRRDHRHGYRDLQRYDRDRNRGGVVIGIGGDRQGVVIWDR